MLYFLSKIVPVPMRTKYKIGRKPYRSSWIQWRGHIYHHKMYQI